MTQFTLTETLVPSLPTNFQTFDDMMSSLMDHYLDLREMPYGEVPSHIQTKHDETSSLPRSAYANA